LVSAFAIRFENYSTYSTILRIKVEYLLNRNTIYVFIKKLHRNLQFCEITRMIAITNACANEKHA